MPVGRAELYSAESVLLFEADAVVQVVVVTRVASRHGARFQVGRVARAGMAERILNIEIEWEMVRLPNNFYL